MTTTKQAKRALRPRLREARAAHVAALPAAARSLAFSIAPSPLAALLDSAAVVAAYFPVGDEANPLTLTGERALALPWFASRAAPMAFRLWRPGTPLDPDPFGARQPTADAPLAEPSLLLMPLLGFDRALHRLGQGAGYYDRYCTAHPDALRIGIAWSAQELEAVPVEAHDAPLDAILTEREWMERKDPRR